MIEAGWLEINPEPKKRDFSHQAFFGETRETFLADRPQRLRTKRASPTSEREESCHAQQGVKLIAPDLSRRISRHSATSLHREQ
jgi:hypothetical protein